MAQHRVHMVRGVGVFAGGPEVQHDVVVDSGWPVPEAVIAEAWRREYGEQVKLRDMGDHRLFIFDTNTSRLSTNIMRSARVTQSSFDGVWHPYNAADRLNKF